MRIRDAFAEAQALGVARLDAQLLLAHLLGRSRAWLLAHDDEGLGDEQATAVQVVEAHLAQIHRHNDDLQAIVSLRLLGSDDFPPAVKAEAARELTAALLEGRLRAAIASRLPLEDIALAHVQVERGAGGRVLLDPTAGASAQV